jgi:putative ABC transport system permease protein
MSGPRLAWRNAFRHRTRALFTIASLVVVIGLYVVLNSLLTVMEAHDAGHATSTRIVVQSATGLANFLPARYADVLAGMPGVTVVNPQVLFVGTWRDNRPENSFGQIATDPDTWIRVFPDYVVAPDELETWRTDPASFIAGAELVRRHGWKVGEPISLRGSYIPVDLRLTLRGVYRGPNEHLIFFHRRQLDDTWLGRAGLVAVFLVRVADAARVPDLVEAVNRRFESGEAPVRAMPESQFLIQFLEMLGDVKQVVRWITLVALTAAILTVGNAIMISVRERAHEVGVMRTMGFGRGHLFALVCTEALIVATIGGVAGVAAGVPVSLGIVEVLRHSPASNLVFNFRVSAAVLGQAFGVAVLIGAVAGLVPGLRVAGLGITQALRRVA